MQCIACNRFSLLVCLAAAPFTAHNPSREKEILLPVKIIRSHLSRSKLLCRCVVAAFDDRVLTELTEHEMHSIFSEPCVVCFVGFSSCHLWHDIHTRVHRSATSMRFIDTIDLKCVLREQRSVGTKAITYELASATKSRHFLCITHSINSVMRRMDGDDYYFTRRGVTWLINVFGFY